MSRPSLYHYAAVLSRSHADTQTDTRIALQKRGFEGAYQNAGGQVVKRGSELIIDKSEVPKPETVDSEL
jgi:hypothetical protein